MESNENISKVVWSQIKIEKNRRILKDFWIIKWSSHQWNLYLMIGNESKNVVEVNRVLISEDTNQERNGWTHSWLGHGPHTLTLKWSLILSKCANEIS